MTGFPVDLLDSYPYLRGYHNKIASLDKIKAKYANAEGLRLAFKPKA